jgi:hypothetical protein
VVVLGEHILYANTFYMTHEEREADGRESAVYWYSVVYWYRATVAECVTFCPVTSRIRFRARAKMGAPLYLSRLAHAL